MLIVYNNFVHFSKTYIENWRFTVFSYVFLILSLLLLLWLIPRGFLPIEDSGIVFTSIQLKDGTSLAKTSELSGEIEKQIMEVEGVQDVMGLVGMNGSNTSMLLITFKPWHERSKKFFECREYFYLWHRVCIWETKWTLEN